MHCRRLFLLKGSCWGIQLCQWLLSLWFPLNWFISSILRLNCTGCSAHFHYILQAYFKSVVLIGWIKHTTLFIAVVSYSYWWYYYRYYYSCNSLVCFLWVRLSVAGKGWCISAGSQNKGISLWENNSVQVKKVLGVNLTGDCCHLNWGNSSW